VPGIIDQVPETLRTAFVNELNAGKYSLLLGAGASRDSTDKSGRNLPLGGELTTELNNLARINQTSLADSYEIAVHRDRGRVEQYFRERFVGCRPCDWMVHLSTCLWRRIWTLNIDDVVEQAYRALDRNGPTLSASYSWQDPVREDFGLQIVHLHGKVFIDQPLELIFSITEYVDAIEKKHAWFPLFFNAWMGSPFITIGSTLFGEYDLAQATRARQPVGKTPSLYISPTISDDMREQLQIRNLIGIELSAKNAADEVLELTKEARSSSYYQWQSTSAERGHIARFASQFELLSLSESDHPKDHDFFLGFEPCWDDIVTNKAAVLRWHLELAEIVSSDLHGAVAQRIHVALGERFSGKTCGAYIVAKILTRQGVSVFRFRGDRTIDVESTLRVLAGRGVSVLLYDGVADFSLDIQSLMDKANERNIRLIVVAMERSTRRRILLQDVSSKYLRFHDKSTGLRIDTLAHGDAKILLDHVTSLGRYARLQRMTDAERVKAFERRNIFDAMSELEFGQGYRDRIRPRLDALPDLESRMIVFMTSFVNSFGYSMPAYLVESLGIKSDKFRGLLQTRAFSELLIEENGRLLSRFRSVSLNSLKGAFSPRDIVEAVSSLMIRLNPYVNKSTRKTRIYEYRVLKAVMRARGLRILLPSANIDQVYENIQFYYGSQAAFWEQRSIGCQLAKQYVQATSYAAKAVDLDPREVRRRTTLGRLLILRSYIDVDPGSPESWDLYGQGKGELNYAATLSPQSGVVLLIRFRQTLALYRELVMRTATMDDYVALEVDLSDVHRDCVESLSLRHTSEQNTVNELYGLFLQLKFVRNGDFGSDEAQKIFARQLPNISDSEIDEYF
jgi:hypothetical protein